jgi:hypothetical protein
MGFPYQLLIDGEPIIAAKVSPKKLAYAHHTSRRVSAHIDCHSSRMSRVEHRIHYAQGTAGYDRRSYAWLSRKIGEAAIVP